MTHTYQHPDTAFLPSRPVPSQQQQQQPPRQQFSQSLLASGTVSSSQQPSGPPTLNHADPDYYNHDNNHHNNVAAAPPPLMVMGVPSTAEVGTREFSHDLYDCCQPNMSDCCLALWLPCVSINRNAIARDGLDAATLPCGCSQVGQVSVFLALAGVFTHMPCVPIAVWSERTKTRLRYGVRGDAFRDAVAACCCQSCSLVQMQREVEHHTLVPPSERAGVYGDVPLPQQFHQPYPGQSQQEGGPSSHNAVQGYRSDVAFGYPRVASQMGQPHPPTRQQSIPQQYDPASDVELRPAAPHNPHYI